MKTKLYKYLNKPYAVVLIMLIAPIFGFIDRNFVFFFGLGVTFLILWGSNFDWSRFGIIKKLNRKTVLKSSLITLSLFIGFDIIIDPILQLFLVEYDLSAFDDIKGNLGGYITLIIVMWVFAAFGEELLFRGYYMKGLATLFGNNNKSWILAALITSLYFGISHAYQGIIGIVSVFLWSLCISLIFNRNRNNLWLLILIHGFYDTIGITLLYLDKGNMISDWIKQMF